MNNRGTKMKDDDKKSYDILYITFIDLTELPQTGSSVRPIKMLEAFQKLGFTIKVLSGWNNKRNKRKKNVKEILRWLKTEKPSICYVEPPSGPFFCMDDLYLLYRLKKLHVPIGLFYRDAYWKFPEISYEGNRHLNDKIKYDIVAKMQAFDWYVFQKTCHTIFFPSQTMADLFDFKKKEILPPGATLYEWGNKSLKEQLTIIYVGGTSDRYGSNMIFKAFDSIYQIYNKVKLIYVTPKEQWEVFMRDKENVKREWLELFHVSGQHELEKLYKRADIALILLAKNKYNNFAVPVKLFEYLSYQKPILSTNCYETSKFIRENQIGWIIEDNADELKKEVLRICYNRKEIEDLKENCKIAIMKNTWNERAKKVVKILQGKEYEDKI